MIGVDSMKCEWCGKEIQNGERFCSSCKATIDSSKKNKRQSETNTTLEPTISKSGVSTFLKIIGVIIIFVGVASLLFALELWVKISILVSSMISGLLLFGFAEIITALLTIKDKLIFICAFIKTK